MGGRGAAGGGSRVPAGGRQPGAVPGPGAPQVGRGGAGRGLSPEGGSGNREQRGTEGAKAKLYAKSPHET